MAEQNQTKKDNRGYLYPNGNKTKPTHPDHTGTIIIDGKESRMAAWENTTTDGKRYLSIITSPPLSPEQQNQFKRTDEPQAAPINNNSNSNSNNETTKTQQDYYNTNSYENSSDDSDEVLAQILKGSDDYDPFK